MPVDREETLKKAEKLLKQGKVAEAIAEYVRLVEDKPSDWNSVNTLGDLYLKAGQLNQAAEQFTRAADHLYSEGFYPRASAVYKKVLKVSSGDDHARWQLADIAGRNGLSLDARSHYGRLIQDRRAAGNEQGAIDCVIRLGQLADAGVDAKRTAAKQLVERGESKLAARLILSIADQLTKDGRLAEALETLQEAAQLDPHDQEIQLKLAAAQPTEAAVESPVVIEEVEPPVLVEEVESPVVIEEVEPPVVVEEVDAPVVIEEVVTPEPGSATPVAGDDAIVLDSSGLDPAVVIEELAAPPDSEPAEPLPLESFFEELRGKVARDEEARAREQLERLMRDSAENRPVEGKS